MKDEGRKIMQMGVCVSTGEIERGRDRQQRETDWVRDREEKRQSKQK